MYQTAGRLAASELALDLSLAAFIEEHLAVRSA